MSQVNGIEYKTIKETIAAVQNAPGSMYTREDVISLLTKIKTAEEESVLPAIHIEELANVIEEVFENCDTSDLVDNEDVELSLNGYNQIEIDGINVDLNSLRQEVVDAVREYFQKTA